MKKYESGTRSMRVVLYNRQKGKCARCEKRMSMGSLQIEVTRPATRGDRTLSNLRLVCHVCDLLRGG